MLMLSFAAGLLLLLVGAETMVKGASRLAGVFGIPHLVIGLTVVAFGTSSPELAVSIKAAVSGRAGIALGNVVGSNIFNVLFILGLSALISPRAASQRLVRLDIPFMIALSFMVLILGLDQRFGRTDGCFLFLGLILYIGFLFHHTPKDRTTVKDEQTGQVQGKGYTSGAWVKHLCFVLFGLGCLILGSRWLVSSAISIADYLGVGELIVGLTIVAAGASLPEVVTAIIASIRGKGDIAVGNIIGSNLFNIMGVLGLAGILSPEGIGVPVAAIRFDIPIMIVVAFTCLPIFITGGMISRWEGALLLAYYAAYVLFLVFDAARHDALPNYRAAMLYFAIPLTMVTLVTVAIRELRKQRRIGRSDL
jgi:cation:H+ antiporter